MARRLFVTLFVLLALVAPALAQGQLCRYQRRFSMARRQGFRIGGCLRSLMSSMQ